MEIGRCTRKSQVNHTIWVVPNAVCIQFGKVVILKRIRPQGSKIDPGRNLEMSTGR